ncbi:hepatic sodium/bile acid cotransporter-like isoform X1 [Centruroides vittatus]|uniref:hepatic sodium/bile acid cotransporter-like isoform X1 n=1 Tax=Centruroides vittatus TaxID=120091 RepID=UPI003510B68E
MMLWTSCLCFNLLIFVKISTAKQTFRIEGLKFFPPHLEEGQLNNVNVITFEVLHSHEYNSSHPDEWKNQSRALKWNSSSAQTLIFEINSKFPQLAEIVENSYIELQPSEMENNFTFTIKNLRIGHNQLLWTLKRKCFFRFNCSECENSFNCLDNEINEISGIYVMNIIKKHTTVHNVFIIIVLALVLLNNINMGCHLSIEDIKGVLKKPTAAIIGLGCQFLFMPLASFGFGKLLLSDYSLRLGLFVLGCSPGGTVSNFWTLIFGGDLELSVTMTFVSTIASIGMMPLWIFTLGGTIFSDGVLQVPYKSIVLSLLGLSIPVGLGLLLQKYRPACAEKSRKISRPFTVICLTVGISIGIYSYLHIFFLFNWNVLIAATAVAWSGYAFGAMFAWLARLTRQQILAVSIETALQNASVAFILLHLSVPQPDADLTAVPVVAQLLVTAAPLWFGLIAFFINKQIKKQKTSKTTYNIRLNKIISRTDPRLKQDVVQDYVTNI